MARDEIVESAPFGYAHHKLVLDEKGIPADYEYLDANLAFERFTGLKRADVLGRRVSEVLPSLGPELADLILLCSQVASGSGPVELEQYSKDLGGWYKIQIFSKEPLFFTTVFTDVSQHHKEAMDLQGFFQVSLDLLCIANQKGEFERVNGAWSRLLGIPETQLRGRRFLDFVHPDDLAATMEALSRLADQVDVEGFVNRYLSGDGSYRWLEWKTHPYGTLIYASARDITSRILTEKKLQESRDYNQTLLAAIPDMIFILDSSGTFLDFKPSTAMEPILAKEKFLGKKPGDVLPPVLARQLLEGLEKTLSSGNPYRFEYELGGGREANHFEARMVPFPGNRALALVRDITKDYKNALEKRQIEAMLDRFFSQSTVAFFFMMLDSPVDWKNSAEKEKLLDWIFDHHKLTRVNQAMMNQYGAREEELLGQTPSDFFSHDMEMGRSVWRTLFDQGRLHMEMEERKRSGEQIFILGDYSCLYDEDGKITGHFGVEVDITNRKRAEGELLEERQRLANIITGTRAGTWEWNIETGETLFNDQWARIVGYTLEELAPVSIKTWESLCHPGDLEKSKTLIEKHFSGHSEYYECEFRMRHRDGSWVWVLDRGKVTSWTPEGKPLLMQGTHQDVSGRKRAEEELNRAMDEARLLAQQATQAARAKSEFLANMSHELRTPLNGVIGFLELLGSTTLNREQKEYLENAQVSGQVLLGVISDILDYSKIEAGKIELSCQSFDLRELLLDCQAIIRVPLEKKALNFQLKTSDNLPGFITSDPLRLRQILLNLLSNGVKFTEKGGITLGVDFKPLDVSKGRFTFYVSDTGIGISPEQRDRLFLAFSQADASITRKYGGTGLGLVISNSLAGYLGSRILLDSHEGEGSKFYFELDAAYNQVPTIQGESIPAGTSFPGGDVVDQPVILVAEDVRLNLILICAVLRQMIPGVKILEAENGKEALDYLEKQKIHLVLMDVQMPVMDGITAGREIRRRDYRAPLGEKMPLYALSAGALREERQRCLEAGMDGFLSKPLNTAELRMVLQKLGLMPNIRPAPGTESR